MYIRYYLLLNSTTLGLSNQQYEYISWPTIVESNPKAPSSIATTPMCSGEPYSFPWIAPLTLDPYIIMLSVKQGVSSSNISCSPSLFSKPLMTILRAPTTFGIIVTFIFHSLFSFLAEFRYLSIISLSFIFILWSTGKAKSTRRQVLFFLLINTSSG